MQEPVESHRTLIDCPHLHFTTVMRPKIKAHSLSHAKVRDSKDCDVRPVVKIRLSKRAVRKALWSQPQYESRPNQGRKTANDSQSTKCNPKTAHQQAYHRAFSNDKCPSRGDREINNEKTNPLCWAGFQLNLFIARRNHLSVIRSPLTERPCAGCVQIHAPRETWSTTCNVEKPATRGKPPIVGARPTRRSGSGMSFLVFILNV